MALTFCLKATKKKKREKVVCAIEREKGKMDYSSYMRRFQPSGLYGQRQIKINTTRVILWRDETNFHGTKRPFFFFFFVVFSLRNLPFPLCPVLYIVWPVYLCIFFFAPVSTVSTLTHFRLQAKFNELPTFFFLPE